MPCPRCGSPDPKYHPAMQHEGEVEVCTHEFHGAQSFQQRVIDEKRELDDKIDKLTAFRDGGRFQTVLPEEQKRLKDQLQVMREYSHILAERILHFK